MPSRIETVSPIRLLHGIGIALLIGLVAGFVGYLGNSLVAVTLGLLALIVCARGVEPLGDTLFYHIVLLATLGLCGLSIVVTSTDSLLSIGLLVVGVIGVLHYARQAIRRSIWDTVS